MCLGRINDRTKDRVRINQRSSHAIVPNERKSRYISPVFTNSSSKDQGNNGSINASNAYTGDTTIEDIHQLKTTPPEKPPRNKHDIQKTRNTTNDISPEYTTASSNVPQDKEIDATSPNANHIKSELSIASEEFYIQTKDIDSRIRISSSTSTLSSRDNTLPIKSLPGPPVPERPLRPALSCYPDLAPVGARHEEIYRRSFGCRMAKSSSRLFSACISGQKDVEEEPTMKLRRSTSEGKVSKRDEARAIKSRSVHFDSNGQGKITEKFTK